MKAGIDRWRRHWTFFERGILIENEIVPSFLDDIDPDRLADDWPGLPEGFRALIGRYLCDHSPDAIPRYFVIGQQDEEEIARRTEIRRRNAAGLAAFLLASGGKDRLPSEA